MLKSKRITRFNLLILTIAILLASLSSCAKASIYDGCETSKENLRIVGKIGKYEVCYDELNYLVQSCKANLASKYGDDIWKTEESRSKYEEELKNMVLDKITANYAILLLSDEYELNDILTDKETSAYVLSEIDSVVYTYALQNNIKVNKTETKNGKLKYEYLDSDGYEKAKSFFTKDLEKMHLSERVMRLTLAVEFAFQKLINVWTGEKNEIIYKDEDIEKYMLSDKFIRTRHVFISNDKGDSVEENRKIANSVYAQFIGGTSMDMLIGSKYNEDVGMTSLTGYYFTYGEMDENYEKAAFALKDNEVSSVVETEKGFFIIERLPKSSSYMLSNISQFSQQIIYALANTKVRDFQKGLTMEFNDFGKSLVFSKMS